MQQHGSNYLNPDPHPTLGMGSVGQNSTFSEHGHVAYQIKENHKCSIMDARRPLPHPIPDNGDEVSWSKFNYLRTWSCCISN